jgi:hypothetical protein
MVDITIVSGLDDPLLEQAWTLYDEAFHELNAYAVQRHLMTRKEFDEVMQDPRVAKYLCMNSRGALCAMSTLTNNLDAWPLISAAYFQRRFPKHHAERRIWWVGFVAVDPHLGRPVHAFERLVVAMQKMVADHHGVVGLDICRYNTDVRRLPQAVNQLVRRITSTVRIDNADEQTYWLYEFPRPDGAQ